MQRSPTNCGINLVRTSSALRRWMACEPLTKRKLSSTTALHANPYPFPRSPDPTPYQIFHLMPDASPNDIKHRYYELVKLYHPDSAESRRHEPDASRRHAMFSAITRAYASLQKGESGGSGAEGSVEAANAAHMWKRAPTLNRRRYEEPMFVDERWKDRIIWGVLGFSFVMVAAQTIVVRKRRIDEFSEHAKVDDYLKSELSALPGTRPAAAKHSKDDILKLRKTS